MIAFLFTLLSCRGPIADCCGGVEDCSNGIDDNGDGLVDCDDPMCGSPRCVLPPVWIAADDCAFDFGADCVPTQVCHVRFENFTDTEAQATLACDALGGTTPVLRFLVEGTEVLGEGAVGAAVVTTLEVDLEYGCAAEESFTVQCDASLTAGEEQAEASFEVRATLVP